MSPVSSIRVFKASWVSDATLFIGLLYGRLRECLAIGNLYIMRILTVVLSTDRLHIVLHVAAPLGWPLGMSAPLCKWRPIS